MSFWIVSRSILLFSCWFTWVVVALSCVVMLAVAFCIFGAVVAFAAWACRGGKVCGSYVNFDGCFVDARGLAYCWEFG